jgi:hypothetical protein
VPHPFSDQGVLITSFDEAAKLDPRFFCILVEMMYSDLRGTVNCRDIKTTLFAAS